MLDELGNMYHALRSTISNRSRKILESTAKRVRRINRWEKRLGFAYVFSGTPLKST